MSYKGHTTKYGGDIYDVCSQVCRSDARVILDLGARWGEGYTHFGSKFHNARYVFVEPIASCCDKIRERMANIRQEWSLIEGILGHEQTSVQMYTFVSDNDQSANLYTDRGGAYGAPTVVDVKVVPYDVVPTVDDNIDFAKINIEGGEFELIETSFFDKIETFVMEAHNRHVAGKSYKDVLSALDGRYDMVTYGNLDYKYCFIVGHRILNA